MGTKRPINLYEYEQLAASKLAEVAYGYLAGGAEDEITLRENQTAFDRLRLRPRALTDVSERNTEVEILGTRSSFPALAAPMAFMKLAHSAGEAAVAQAVSEAATIMTASTLATISLERIAEVGGSALWFQLYVYRDRGVTTDLVQRAKAAGYRALVLTTDVPVQGKRERDIRNAFRVPDGLEPENLLPYMQDLGPDADPTAEGASYATVPLFDPALTWDDVDWLCSLTDLPVLVKGILRGDDARRAVDHGARGVIVSNHGGRQLDTALSSIQALPEVAEAVDGRVPVLMDGGVRRGTHILKAIALGAQAVLVGRPLLWGLAVSGQAGVSHVLQILRTEFDSAMALCGCPRVEDIGSDLIA